MYCERYKCTLMVAACLENQKRTAAAGREAWGRTGYINCANCPQAEAARQGQYNDDDVAALVEEGMKKRCLDCGVEKELHEFPARGGKCRECVAEYQWQWREQRTGVSKDMDKKKADGREYIPTRSELSAVVEERPEATGPTMVCRNCGREKPVEEFSRNVKSKTGRLTICKACQGGKMRRPLSRVTVMHPGIMALDLRGHPEIREGLEKAAARELRTPENMAVVLIRDGLAGMA